MSTPSPAASSPRPGWRGSCSRGRPLCTRQTPPPAWTLSWSSGSWSGSLLSEGGDVTILVCLNVVVVVTQRYHLVRRVLPDLLQRVEVVGDVPGDEVDPELVHEVVEPLAGLHLEVPDHKGRQRHVSVSGCAGVPRPTVPAAGPLWSPGQVTALRSLTDTQHWHLGQLAW